MLALVCLLLGLCINISANDCTDIKPMDDFSLKRFSENWYISSLKIGNPSDETKYFHPSCGTIAVDLDAEQKPQNWTVVLVIEKTPIFISGNYTMPDVEKGLMKLEYLKRALIYDYVIKCTDYESYTVGYTCVQVGPGESSEFIHILTRDHTKYEEIIALPVVKECFAEITSKPIEEELQKLPFDNCPNTQTPRQ